MNELSATEKRDVVSAVQKAAVAVAELWDVLKGIEDTHNVEFDGTDQMVGLLASQCAMPPQPEDVTEEDVLTVLEEYVTRK
jgi:hypothetical protein